MNDVLAKALNSHQEGRLHEAKTLYRQVLAAEPDHPDALHYMGVLCLQNDDGAEAVRLIERALALNPGNPDALNNLGQAFAGLNRWPDAEAAYRKALALAPDFAPAHSNLGDALMQQGAVAAAAASYQTALKTFPGDPEILVSLGKALAMQERHVEAIGYFRQALEAAPDDAIALTNLGIALQAQGQPDDAIAAFARAIAIEPDLAEAHYNLGLTLHAQDRLEESMASFHRVLALDPDNADAHHNMGLSLFLQGRFEDAQSRFRRAIEIDSDNADSHHNLSLSLLLQSRFEQGWAEYEWRWQAKKGREVRDFPQKRWQGEDLKGKTILVSAEQGVGDEIWFAGMVPDLVARGARVVLEAESRLVPLFGRSFPGVECLAKETPPSAEARRRDIDFQVAAGSLGQWLRPDPAAFPDRPCYLVADAKRRAALRKRYLDGGSDLLVGLSWESKNKRIGDYKSMPLDGFRPLTGVSGVTFVDLQYGDTAADRRDFEENTGVSLRHDDGVDQFADLDLFAAQVAAMDLVISVSNTTVHMAGALGVPTWVMLNTVPLSCWLLDREDSPWYSSVRLFRQQHRGVWADVIERMASQLEHLGSIRR